MKVTLGFLPLLEEPPREPSLAARPRDALGIGEDSCIPFSEAGLECTGDASSLGRFEVGCRVSPSESESQSEVKYSTAGGLELFWVNLHVG